MKQVLASPNKSTMINNLIKNYSQKNAETVGDYPASHRDAEIHALQNGNLQRPEVSKIEDRVQCQTRVKYQKSRRDFFVLVETCCKALPRRSSSRQKQRINSRFIMYVPGIHNTALRKIQRGRCYGNSAESPKFRRRHYLNSAKKQNCGTIVERYPEEMHVHEQGYTQSDMKEFDVVANEKTNYVGWFFKKKKTETNSRS